ncbi:glycosyltransferase [Metabacillus fastidiosus]|uniref:CgeB family protein n=1 Tax=Metabacillus fastidiosus TaxID=1458 RepID=UPI002E20264F|nr:glycosyltransferase [Metabacillus fastidiosus]
MKILYIHCGYETIYPYLEDWLIKGFEANRIEVEIISSEPSLQDVQQMIINKKPLFAFTMIGNKLHIDLIKFLKQEQIPLVIWLTEDPYYTDQSLQKMKIADIIFTIDLGSYNYYKQSNYNNIYYLPLGTNESTFNSRVVDEPYTSDLLLLGFPYPSRVALIEEILKNTKYNVTLVGKGWRIRIQKKYRFRHKITIIDKWVPPELVAQYYNGAKIVLNPHRESNYAMNKNSLEIKNKSINNRTFDIAACGNFQLIEHKQDVFHQFSSEEMITYENTNDCLNKIFYYMENETERAKIALLARERALSHHTMTERAKTIIQTVLSEKTPF